MHNLFCGSTDCTKRYPPLKVLEVIPNTTYLLETKVTRDYVNKYGKDRVRGRKYVGGKGYYGDDRY